MSAALVSMVAHSSEFNKWLWLGWPNVVPSGRPTADGDREKQLQIVR